MKTIRNYVINGQLLQGGSGNPVQVNNPVRLYLDTEAEPGFPEYIDAMVVHPIVAVNCGTATAYSFEYDEDDLEGAKAYLLEDDIVDVENILESASSVLWNNVLNRPPTFPPSDHTHGNITNAGAIGTTADQVVVTGTSGVLGVRSRSGVDTRTSFPNDAVTAATPSATPNTLVMRNARGGGVLFAETADNSTTVSISNSGNGFDGNPIALRVQSDGLNGTGAFISSDGIEGNAGAIIICTSGVGASMSTSTGDYHATFGDSSINQSFVARDEGAFGWFRGAFTGRIAAVGTLTEDRYYTLQDESGFIAMVNDPRFADERIPINSSVTNVKLANMAGGTVKGRAIGAAGFPQDLTTAQQRELAVAAFNAGTEDTTPADADRLAVTSPAGGWITLGRIFAFIRTQLGLMSGAVTAAGEWAFPSTTRPTSAGTGTPAANSLITREDGDVRYGAAIVRRITTAVSAFSTTPVNSLETQTVPAGTYEVRGFLACSTASTTAGAQVEVMPSNTSADVTAITAHRGTSTTLNGGTTSTSSSIRVGSNLFQFAAAAFVDGGASGLAAWATIHGTVVFTAPQTITFRIRQRTTTDAVNPAVLQPGSFIEFRPIQ